jgi:YVTN family beta-propeller protein
MKKTWIAGALAVSALAAVAQQAGLFAVLRHTARIGLQGDGSYLLPTSQLLRPAGRRVAIPGRPVDLAIDSRGRLLAVLNNFNLKLIDAPSGAELATVRTKSTSWSGIAFRPGDREVWASEALRNGPDSLFIWKLSETGAPAGEERIALPGRHPTPVGIAFSADGKTAYIALSRDNALAVIDAESRQVAKTIPIGLAPHAVLFAAQTKRVYVSCRGGLAPKPGAPVGPSSGTQLAVDVLTGSVKNGTLAVVDPESGRVEQWETGRAPSGLALSPDGKTLVVCNGHSDSLSFFDTASGKRTDVKLPAEPDGGLGSQPVAARFLSDTKLAVALAGENALAILETAGGQWKRTGEMPVGWFPTAIAVDAAGRLQIVCVKGTGNTANGKGAFNSRAYEGLLTTLEKLDAGTLKRGQEEVRAANAPKFEPQGGVDRLDRLGIEHVFFVIKENRTYDQVFGDMGRGNSDPKLVMYGRNVTPNHHKLADEWVLLDNFYTSGAISFEGHQWLMQAFVSDYVERALQSAPRGYAWNMSDALTVSPAGFFWQGSRRPLTVRVFGEFSLPHRWSTHTESAVDVVDESELPEWRVFWQAYQSGHWREMVGSKSGVPELAPLMVKEYPAGAMNIPDQMRADVFLDELKKWESAGQAPNVSVICLNNDHTVGTRPNWPTPRAMVADNDLALGRMVEALSRSRFWAKSLILVVEDDAQDGVDHVDGHRTVALAIGPHVRREHLESGYYDQLSMVRTIQEIFGIPPSTRFVRHARAMNAVFTTAADSRPYTALPSNLKFDELNPPLKALNGRRLWAARQSLAMDFSEVDDVPSDVLNRILWWDAKGWETEMPVLRASRRAR